MQHFRFSHRALAVAVGVLALLYSFFAFRIPSFEGVDVPVQPGALPRGLGVVLLLLAVALFFQNSRADEHKPEAHAPSGDDAAGDDAASAEAVSTEAVSTEPVSAGPASTADPGGTAQTGTAARTDEAAAGSATLGRFSDTRLELGFLLGSMVVYVALFVPLGFMVATTLYVTGTAWYLGFRRHWLNVLVAAGLSVAFYYGMTRGLDVTLPNGPLPF